MTDDINGATEEKRDRRSDANSDEFANSKAARRTLLGRILAASTILGIGVSGNAAAQNDGDETDDAETSAAKIAFQNQPSNGAKVAVESVQLPDGGYVAIYHPRVLEGEADDIAETIVGVSDYLDAGEHSDIEFNLFHIEGIDFDTGEIHEDQWLVAIPHRETNENETYEFVATGGEEDGPYTAVGEPIADIAFVTVEDARI